MLAKKRAAKKAAIAAVAVKGSSTGAPRSETSTATPKKTVPKKLKNSSARATGDEAANYFVNGAQRRVSAKDALEGKSDHGDAIRALGDNINTRFQEMVGDDDLDADLYDDKTHELLEEARMVAGTKQRVVSTALAQFLKKHHPALNSLQDSQRQMSARIKDQVVGANFVRVRHNCNAVTAVATLNAELVVMGDKTGKVYLAHIAEVTTACGMPRSQRDGVQRGTKLLLEPPMPAAVVSLALSDTRASRPTSKDLFERTTEDHSCLSYIAAGSADGSIGIWETFTRRYKGLLVMHRKPVTGLSFRTLTSTLYSCSEDGTLRVWNVPQMMAADKLFGHEGKVFGVHSLRRETCATVGDDGTMRFWKLEAATQQGFEYSTQHRIGAQQPSHKPQSASADSKKDACHVAMECVCMLNESIVLCGAVDGSLVVFDVNRRRPVIVLPAAHGYGFMGDGTGIEKEAALLDTTGAQHMEAGTPFPSRQNPNLITAVAAIPYADVVASASYDGIVRLWHIIGVGSGAVGVGKRTEERAAGDAMGNDTKPRLALLAELPIDALVTSLTFSANGDVLVVGCSKEPRLGRWVVLRRALNSVCVIPLTDVGLTRIEKVANIEHVPALLYGITDPISDGEGSEDADMSGDMAERTGMISDLALERDFGTADPGEEADEEAPMFQVGAEGQLQFSPGALLKTATDAHRSGRVGNTKKKKSSTSRAPASKLGKQTGLAPIKQPAKKAVKSSSSIDSAAATKGVKKRQLKVLKGKGA